MKRRFLILISLVAFLSGCASDEAKANEPDSPSMNDLGAMTSEKALEYMKTTPNLIIVDVAAKRWYEQQHFEEAVNIPIEDISGSEADKLYRELPQGKPVILHCRRGMIVPGAYRRVKELRPDIPEISYIDGVPPFDDYNNWKQGQTDTEEIIGDKLLGGLSPKDALEYMKSTKNLAIVEVRTPEWLGSTWFTGAILIPHTEMVARYSEIPADRPVILNCGGGVNAPKAYEVLKEKRPDIPQLSYIAGSPLFREYNEWHKNNR